MLFFQSVVAGFALAISTVALAGNTPPASAADARQDQTAGHKAHGHKGHGSDHAAAMNALWTAPTLDVARWEQQFENPQRDVIANRAALVAALRLQPGERVADVGAGTGAYLGALSAAVGPEGHVLAVDISPGFVMHITQRAGHEGWGNVSAVLGRGDDPTLPAGALDAIITVNTFHHFEAPETMLAHLARALKPGGRLLVVDFSMNEHTSAERQAMTGRDKETVIAFIKAAGFALDEDVSIPTLRENYALRFRRRSRCANVCASEPAYPGAGEEVSAQPRGPGCPFVEWPIGDAISRGFTYPPNFGQKRSPCAIPIPEWRIFGKPDVRSGVCERPCLGRQQPHSPWAKRQ